MAVEPTVNRRAILRGGTALSGLSLLNLSGASLLAVAQSACSAKKTAAPFKVLGAEEARVFAAIASRIMPTTDTPGATEAGVIYFMDGAFADAMSDALGFARAELKSFNAALDAFMPGHEGFDTISESDQDRFLETQQDGDLFNLLWVMTMFGMFSMSKYGGNRDNVGWKLVGFEGDRGVWQYPFGYYDAPVHGGQNDGE